MLCCVVVVVSLVVYCQQNPQSIVYKCFLMNDSMLLVGVTGMIIVVSSMGDDDLGGAVVYSFEKPLSNVENDVCVSARASDGPEYSSTKNKIFMRVITGREVCKHYSSLKIIMKSVLCLFETIPHDVSQRRREANFFAFIQ